MRKIENSPPHRKTAPLKRLNFRIWPKNQSQFRRRPFFYFLETTCFWAEKTFEFRIWAEKSVSISAKTFFIFLFFLETTCFWAEKTFEFRIWAEKSVSISAKIFFFWRPPAFGRKKPLNFGFGPKNQSQFRRRPFLFFLFFLETTCFWAEKTFEFPSFPRNFASIFGQTV